MCVFVCNPSFEKNMWNDPDLLFIFVIQIFRFQETFQTFTFKLILLSKLSFHFVPCLCSSKILKWGLTTKNIFRCQNWKIFCISTKMGDCLYSRGNCLPQNIQSSASTFFPPSSHKLTSAAKKCDPVMINPHITQSALLGQRQKIPKSGSKNIIKPQSSSIKVSALPFSLPFSYEKECRIICADSFYPTFNEFDEKVIIHFLW